MRVAVAVAAKMGIASAGNARQATRPPTTIPVVDKWSGWGGGA